ncbi:Mechanosensitive ion channel protein [Seminavis robusta]|uniref:Mechanosensitive ion channel protein n=1 Tax=Seminavis robusta TaxID=568900 RepID=A0A9N8HRG2_9STRA|nr:Mechanosensitive ion channel protein [Seminavis robusta]|eukprot:Sro1318_g262230.1 Mechanosensitive ion channel protein (997) ;mRNA; f:25196-28950
MSESKQEEYEEQERKVSFRSSELRHRKPRNVATMVMQMNRESKRNLFDEDDNHNNNTNLLDSTRRTSAALIRSRSNEQGRRRQKAHRRYYSAFNVPYHEDAAANDTPSELADTSIPLFGPSQAPTSSLLNHAQHLENLFQTPARGFNDLLEPYSSPFYGTEISYHSQRNRRSITEEETEGDDDDDDSEDDISDVSSQDEEKQDVEQGNQVPQEKTRLIETTTTSKRRKSCCCRLTRVCRAFVQVVKPEEVLTNIHHFLSTTFLLLIVPCLIAASILYYSLDNPDLEFLPTQARLSWFMLFIVRLSVTFTLARMTQWMFEVLTMRTTIFARACGPLFALVMMQSMGWPLLACSWGCWNLIILHGDSNFVKHWFYWTGIKLFSIQFNRGDGILASELYGRFLAAIILLGVAAAIKRTFVALYLSRRMLQHYRGQLEKVMSQVKLVMEVTELAAQTDEPSFNERLSKVINEGGSAAEVVDRSKRNKLVETQTVLDAQNSGMNAKMKWNMLKERALNDRYTMNFNGDEVSTAGRTSAAGSTGERSTARKNTLKMIFDGLERWPEPEDKGRKNTASSLHDILQFRKAMAFMETQFPFSEKFGPVANRKQCVKNAMKVYKRLLRFTPGQQTLSFDVIGALAFRDDQTLDENRAIALLRVFLPDKNEALTMLAFVNSTDNVYKQLRYLRAALSNSSKIDSVLEDSFNGVFYAVLAVILLCLCGFNPWPLLVSFSTLTVSFAFAFGPSVAKNVEGVLMIAVRRPYDIGDRITISGAESLVNPPLANSWLVEDITLTTTTLRFASTNEVASLNNSSLASSRIVNCSRSPKAQVTIRIQLDVDTSQRDIDEFRKRIETYLSDNPRIWVGLIQSRTDDINSDAGYATMMYRAQHVKPWQDLGPIMSARGEWQRFAENTATDMGIIYDSPPRQMTIGVGLAAESKQNKATEGQNKTASFIRSLSKEKSGGQHERKTTDERVFGSISKYMEDSQPAPTTLAMSEQAAAD